MSALSSSVPIRLDARLNRGSLGEILGKFDLAEASYREARLQHPGAAGSGAPRDPAPRPITGERRSGHRIAARRPRRQ